MITIVNYGLGNILAFANVYKSLGIPVTIAEHRGALAEATRIILPGVGAFDHAMELLMQSGMRETLDELVLGRGVPVLGVCVGMQMLAASSEEGTRAGLGWVRAVVRKFNGDGTAAGIRLPHMGWNDVVPAKQSPMLAGLEHNARFYFLHSYHVVCENTVDVLATTEYGTTFTSALHSGCIVGAQFHPEKSHHFGAQLLRNFASLPEC